MSVPKISILVPVYKVEAYLARCIESVLAQDFQDWEMILVDDGSPDRSPQICDEYADRDARIRVVHKVNGGLVSARLAGWKEAKGDYVLNLDSDDYLLPNAITALYKKAVEGDYDIVKGSNQRVFDDGTFCVEAPTLKDVEIIGSDNYLRALLSYEILPYLWGGLYRKILFSEVVFNYVLNISIGEDWITNQAIYKGVHRYVAIDNVVCAYYINSVSMMQRQVMSHEYHECFRDKMRGIASGAPQNIQYLIKRDGLSRHIKCFFTPEIGWSNEWYDKIRAELDADSCMLEEIKQHGDAKFVRFIMCKPLFRLYSCVYRILFKRIRLKGCVRRVI